MLYRQAPCYIDKHLVISTLFDRQAPSLVDRQATCCTGKHPVIQVQVFWLVLWCVHGLQSCSNMYRLHHASAGAHDDFCRKQALEYEQRAPIVSASVQHNCERSAGSGCGPRGSCPPAAAVSSCGVRRRAATAGGVPAPLPGPGAAAARCRVRLLRWTVAEASLYSRVGMSMRKTCCTAFQWCMDTR